MNNKTDFFNINNTVLSLSNVDAQQTSDYLATIKAIAKLNNMCLYVIDYHKQGFEYVSENPLFLCGLSKDEVQEMGYDFYFKFVPKEDLNLLLKINQIGFDKYLQIPIENRLNYTICYDFKLINSENKTTLINHKLIPLFLTKDGKVWKAICLVTLSTSTQSGNIKVFNEKGQLTFKYNLNENYWINVKPIVLSEREKEIIRLSVKGFKVNEIASALFISSNTVKFHKKQLFEKLNVTTMNDAIFYSYNNYLI
ncbi:helix-turn-helix transcriptional regulator [Croceivirga sp. JEA036]|uniref:helix-turn-helix transcriptional regulator n=1 Tax=Croceivirga sp. JEA036 TaxID=2721162 RepID=UPI00143C1704|nr:LuxR C-terminal-related transcriptional regulator [Croceivirga sp. JEA036]NJB37983.1 helix-turn-helix transcriptional regulator [Croceivirga sp. JEA036]